MVSYCLLVERFSFRITALFVEESSEIVETFGQARNIPAARFFSFAESLPKVLLRFRHPSLLLELEPGLGEYLPAVQCKRCL